MLIISDQYNKEDPCRLEAPTVPCCLYVLGITKIICFSSHFVVLTSLWLPLLFGENGLAVYNLMLFWAMIVSAIAIMVNLCQKLSFLHLLTHYMTTDISLNYMKKQVQHMLCTIIAYTSAFKIDG